MAKAIQWVKTLTAEDEESLSSYLGRWARDNHIGSRRTLLSELEVSHALRPSDQDMRQLSDALGVPKDVLQALAPSDAPSRPALRKSLTRIRSEAICPHCLQVGNYIRQVWSHALAFTCATHAVTLIDRCPSCASSLKSNRSHANRCDCGFDLRQVPAEPASLIEIEFATLLNGRRVEASTLPLQEGATAPADIDLFMLGLANHLQADEEQGPGTKPGKSALPRSVDEARARMTPALALTQDWPHRFHKQVGQWLAGPARSSTVSAKRRLGPWYNFLFHKFSGPTYAAWREAAANMIVKSGDGLANARTSNLFSAATVQKDWFTLAEAARRLQVRAERLAQGIDDGLIQATCHDQAPGYRQRFLSRTEIDRLIEVRHAHVDAKQACQRLGVAASILQSLLDAGLVEVVDIKQIAPVTQGVILKRSLAALEHRLTLDQPLIQITASSTRLVSLRSLNLRRTTDRRKLHDLFVAIEVGSLRPVGIDGSEGIGGVLFEGDDVDARLASRVVARSLTAQQVSALTGAHYDAVRGWIDAGLLPATLEPLEQGAPWVVDIRGLITFLQTYAPLAGQAKQCDSTSRGLASRLERAGVSPVVVGQSGRGALVRISDLLGSLRGDHSSGEGVKMSQACRLALSSGTHRQVPEAPAQ
ncbi:MAG: TniQ family protein [Leptothrix sp. (in: b-proteobacteria)]